MKLSFGGFRKRVMEKIPVEEKKEQKKKMSEYDVLIQMHRYMVDRLMTECKLEDVIRCILERKEHWELEQMIKRLLPSWRDKYDYEFWFQRKKEYFRFHKKERRHFPGGSWTPECDYDHIEMKCRLCGEIVPDDYMGPHLTKCGVLYDLMQEFTEEDYFWRALGQVMSKNDRENEKDVD